MKVIVAVDATRCVASKTCVRTARGLFELGDDNVARLTRPYFADDELELLREAEELCPTAAIRVKLEES